MPKNIDGKRNNRLNFADKILITALSIVIASLFHDGTNTQLLYSIFPFTATMITGIIITEKEKEEQ